MTAVETAGTAIVRRHIHAYPRCAVAGEPTRKSSQEPRRRRAAAVGGVDQEPLQLAVAAEASSQMPGDVADRGRVRLREERDTLCKGVLGMVLADEVEPHDSFGRPAVPAAPLPQARHCRHVVQGRLSVRNPVHTTPPTSPTCARGQRAGTPTAWKVSMTPQASRAQRWFRARSWVAIMGCIQQESSQRRPELPHSRRSSGGPRSTDLSECIAWIKRSILPTVGSCRLGPFSGIRAQRVFENLRNLGSGEPPGHDVDHGQTDHCLRCTCIEFIVLAHPPKPSQPCEGALDDPATRQELESLGVVASLHDL